MSVPYSCTEENNNTGEEKSSFVFFTGHPKTESHIDAVLWFQTAGERHALSYQAFNLAKLRLDQDLNNEKENKKRAIVIDVDETVLDNSPYEAKAALIGQSYPTGWSEWVNMASAQAIPGALDFLKYAYEKDVSVFYVTNRKISGQEATLKNLKNLGFPVTKDSVLFRTDTRSKVSRRNQILQNHRIVLLIGDNLADFDEVFEMTSNSSHARNQAVYDLRHDFGQRFIVLPNPIYGDWLGSVYEGNWGLSEAEKAKKKRESLRYYH